MFSLIKNKKLYDIINFLFLFCIIIFLLIGFGVATLNRKDQNGYENRTAYKLTLPTVKTWLDESFQDNTELAINDQILLADRIKLYFLTYNNTIVNKSINLLLEKNTNYEIHYGDYFTYDGKYLLEEMTDLNDSITGLDKKIDNINTLIKNYPDISFYMYYIEKCNDIDFSTNEKSGIYEYFADKLNISDDNKSKFAINDYNTYKNYFFQTDHHWNYTGAYEGYNQVGKLILKDAFNSIAHGNIGHISDSYMGSRALSYGTGTFFKENFDFYYFDFPNIKLNISINGKSVDDYGNQNKNNIDEFINSDGSKVKSIDYGVYFGGDDAEIIFNSGKNNENNILIIGDSFDNAILKLLAYEFDNLYSIDLRHYERIFGEKFDFGNYIEKNKINKVLFIGNNIFYASDDFIVED